MPRGAPKKPVRPRSVSSRASARLAAKPVPAGRAKAKAKPTAKARAAASAARARKPAARATKPKPPAGKTAARKPAKIAARRPTRTTTREAEVTRKPAVPATRKPARRVVADEFAVEAPAPPAVALAPRTRARSAAGGAATPRTSGARRTRSRPAAAAAAVGATEEAEPAGAPAAPPERFAFPETYGKTRVRVLMQSPGRLFVHWDLSPGVIEELKGQFGQRAASLARLAIRITTPGAARPLLVLLPRGARSWYVDVPGQRQEYCAEIGLMLPSGEFRSVAASNVVRMPRTAPSPTPASRRVAFQAGETPPAGSVLEIPPDEPSGEEALLEAAEHEDEAPGEAGGASGVPGAPGGSSEMSGGGRRRRARVPAARPTSTSDRAATGSSSDLRPRRKPG